MACGGLCQVGSGAGCDSCKLAAQTRAIQGALYVSQSNRQVLGGMFGRSAGQLSRGIGQLVPVRRPTPMLHMVPRVGPPHHRKRRGLGQAVVDVNPSDYTNLGFDQTTATAMAQLDNNFNAGSLGTGTTAQTAYINQAQANLATLTPTGTVDENAADYTAIGWSQAAAQAAANAATDYNAGTTTLAQYASAMQLAVGQMFSGATVAPSTAQVSAGVTPTAPSLTGAQQAAVDTAAIQGATSVLNTGIAGAVAASKGQQLSTTAANTPTARTPAAGGGMAALTTNQKIGLGIGAVVVVVGIGWAMSGGRRGRRRRR